MNFLEHYATFVAFLAFLIVNNKIVCTSESCSANSPDDSCNSKIENLYLNQENKRYLLYEVNPAEGFNLRRDVYMRIATLVKNLNKKENWVLVLPPWGPLYHWKTKLLGKQDKLKWSKFFNVSHLQQYVHFIELEDFLKEAGPSIDVLYYLQNYAEGWSEGAWEEKSDIRKCNEVVPYEETERNKFESWFWGYESMYAKSFHCLSIQGSSNTLKKRIEELNTRVIMIDRAEVILHDTFGEEEYWSVRRSMFFADELIELGNNFRKLHLNSTDIADRTVPSGSIQSSISRTAIGGPYLAVHLRRKEFLVSRPKEIPSVEFAIKQLQNEMKELELQLLYIATDDSEFFDEISHRIPGAKRFKPSKEVHREILDGGVAIIDQWICAHARYFLGSHESTFSFRIQEEREILGFPIETTFNRMCGDFEAKCPSPSKWTIVF